MRGAVRLLRPNALVNLANFAIISFMMVCIASLLVRLGQALKPDWPGEYLLGVCFLVALESAVLRSKRSLRHLNFPSPWLVYRGVEWIAIMIGLKFVIHSLRGAHPIGQDFSLWLPDFINSSYTDELLAAGLVVTIAWGLAGQLSGDLADLEVEEQDLAQERLSGSRDLSRSDTRQHLVNLILIIGTSMVFVTAVIRTSLRAQVSGASILRPPSDVLNTLIYFLLGLILISQARFALLRADWNGEHIPISRGLPARWAMYTLLLLSGIAAVASVLPTRDTLGLLNALGYLLSIVSIIFQLVVLAITSIVSFVIGLFMSLIGRPSTPPPSAPAQPLPVNPTPIAVSIPWGEVAKSLVFWIVFLGMLGYVLLRYLRQHPAILIKVRQMPAVIWLGQTWRRVRDRLRGARARLAAVLKSAPRPSRTQHVRQPTHAAPRWVNLRRLSPRQRVQFFYLAMVRRGGEAGVGRQPSHTPYEYAIILREGRPEVIDEVTGLTEEFVEARYSRREIALEEARLVQRYWDRIKRALRRQGR